MTTIYSILKRLIPRPVRTFVKDLDSAYHQLERKTNKQQQVIKQLDNSYKELQLSYQQLQLITNKF